MVMALYIYLALALFVYFFPTYLAFVRGHVDWKGVFFTNLAIAWTIVGWFVLFIWAFDVEKRN